MADDGIFLERFHVGAAPAVEVVVGGVELPHVIETEEIILALAAPPHGRAVQAGCLAAFPLASGSGGLRRRCAARLRRGSSRSILNRVSLLPEYGRKPCRAQGGAAIVTRAVARLL